MRRLSERELDAALGVAERAPNRAQRGDAVTAIEAHIAAVEAELAEAKRQALALAGGYEIYQAENERLRDRVTLLELLLDKGELLVQGEPWREYLAHALAEGRDDRTCSTCRHELLGDTEQPCIACEWLLDVPSEMPHQSHWERAEGRE